MPSKTTVKRAKEDLREGKLPTTAAANSSARKSSMSAAENMARDRLSK